MKSVIAVMTVLLSTYTFSAASLNCELVYGEGVYINMSVEFQAIDDSRALPYSLKEIVGTEVIIDGTMNQNHEDNDDIGEEWTYVTPGARTTAIRNDEWNQSGLGFYVDTCEDCDFNGATYQYRRSNEGEIFITEMYGSDGSGEFSLYSCERN